MKSAFFINFILMAILVAPSLDVESMKAVDNLWREHNSQAAFRAILKAKDEGKTLDALKLAELTGVRKIEKIIPGKGDEDIFFLGDDYVVLAGFTGSLRIGKISSRKIIREFPAPTTPIWDSVGVVCYRGEKIYYVRKEEGKSNLYEFDLRNSDSRLLGDFPFKSAQLGYDESLGLLQLINVNGKTANKKILATFDLKKGKKIDYDKPVKMRELPKEIKVDAKPGTGNLRLTFGEKQVEMPYPRDEYLDGGLKRDLMLDYQHPDSILVTSLWYPGLKILLDIKNKRSYKTFVPIWLDPDTELVRWKQIGSKLYFWRQKGRRSGLYEIDLGFKPSFSDLCSIIRKYKLIKD